MHDQETLFCVSIWSRVELRSALGLKVRIGELTQRQADDSHETFEQSFLPSLKEWPIERRHFARSVGLLKNARSGLSGPDALHLAVCLDGGGVTLATSDANLFKVAKAFHQKGHIRRCICATVARYPFNRLCAGSIAVK